jgi:hypothetical protein
VHRPVCKLADARSVSSHLSPPLLEANLDDDHDLEFPTPR